MPRIFPLFIIITSIFNKFSANSLIKTFRFFFFLIRKLTFVHFGAFWYTFVGRKAQANLEKMKIYKSPLDFVSAPKRAVYFSCIFNQRVLCKGLGGKNGKKKGSRLDMGEIFQCPTVVTLGE